MSQVPFYTEDPLSAPAAAPTLAETHGYIPQPPPVAPQPQPYGSGLAGLASIAGSVYTALSTSGVAKEAYTTLKAIADRSSGDGAMVAPELMIIEDSRLMIAAIVSYIPIPMENTCYYLVHLLEKTMVPVTNKTKPVGNTGRTIELDLPCSKFYSPRMRAVTEELLTRQLINRGIAEMPLFWVDSTVVPKDTQLTNEEAMAPFFYHAMSEIYAIISVNNHKPSIGMTGAMLKSNDIALVSRFEITPGATDCSTIGQVMAKDFAITTVATSANKMRTADIIHGNGDDQYLTAVKGFVDFRRRPQNHGYAQGFVTGYNPVIVLTEITTLGKSVRNLDSLMSMLLALPSVMPLLDGDSMRWTTIFEPFIGDSRKTSLGALSLEHNPEPRSGIPFMPKITEIVSNNGVYDPNRMTTQEFVRIYVDPAPIVAMDILQGGPLERIQAILMAAFPGTQEEAIIINELNAFSGGIFGSIWNGGKNILASQSTIIHAGTYTDETGMRDIRSIDYLSVLDRCNGDPAIIDKFAYGFLPGTGSEEMLDSKRRELKTMVANLIITGLYTRIFINPEFIQAIDKMLTALGLQYNVEGLVDQLNTGMYRHAYQSENLIKVNSQGAFNTNNGINPIGVGYNGYNGGFSPFRS